MHTITAYGQDGTAMHYHAVVGEDFSVPEVGWVLVMEGGSVQLEPQALTAADVVGDLLTMMPADSELVQSVDAMTVWMLDDLRGRGTEEAMRRAEELAEERQLAAALVEEA